MKFMNNLLSFTIMLSLWLTPISAIPQRQSLLSPKTIFSIPSPQEIPSLSLGELIQGEDIDLQNISDLGKLLSPQIREYFSKETQYLFQIPKAQNSLLTRAIISGLKKAFSKKDINLSDIESLKKENVYFDFEFEDGELLLSVRFKNNENKSEQFSKKTKVATVASVFLSSHGNYAPFQGQNTSEPNQKEQSILTTAWSSFYNQLEDPVKGRFKKDTNQKIRKAIKRINTTSPNDDEIIFDDRETKAYNRHTRAFLRNFTRHKWKTHFLIHEGDSDGRAASAKFVGDTLVMTLSKAYLQEILSHPESSSKKLAELSTYLGLTAYLESRKDTKITKHASFLSKNMVESLFNNSSIQSLESPSFKNLNTVSTLTSSRILSQENQNQAQLDQKIPEKNKLKIEKNHHNEGIPSEKSSSQAGEGPNSQKKKQGEEFEKAVKQSWSHKIFQILRSKAVSMVISILLLTTIGISILKAPETQKHDIALEKPGIALLVEASDQLQLDNTNALFPFEDTNLDHKLPDNADIKNSTVSDNLEPEDHIIMATLGEKGKDVERTNLEKKNKISQPHIGENDLGSGFQHPVFTASLDSSLVDLSSGAGFDFSQVGIGNNFPLFSPLVLSDSLSSNSFGLHTIDFSNYESTDLSPFEGDTLTRSGAALSDQIDLKSNSPLVRTKNVEEPEESDLKVEIGMKGKAEGIFDLEGDDFIKKTKNEGAITVDITGEKYAFNSSLKIEDKDRHTEEGGIENGKGFVNFGVQGTHLKSGISVALEHKIQPGEDKPDYTTLGVQKEGKFLEGQGKYKTAIAGSLEDMDRPLAGYHLAYMKLTPEGGHMTLSLANSFKITETDEGGSDWEDQAFLRANSDFGGPIEISSGIKLAFHDMKQTSYHFGVQMQPFKQWLPNTTKLQFHTDYNTQAFKPHKPITDFGYWDTFKKATEVKVRGLDLGLKFEQKTKTGGKWGVKLSYFPSEGAALWSTYFNFIGEGNGRFEFLSHALENGFKEVPSRRKESFQKTHETLSSMMSKNRVEQIKRFSKILQESHQLKAIEKGQGTKISKELLSGLAEKLVSIWGQTAPEAIQYRQGKAVIHSRKNFGLASTIYTTFKSSPQIQDKIELLVSDEILDKLESIQSPETRNRVLQEFLFHEVSDALINSYLQDNGFDLIDLKKVDRLTQALAQDLFQYESDHNNLLRDELIYPVFNEALNESSVQFPIKIETHGGGLIKRITAGMKDLPSYLKAKISPQIDKSIPTKKASHPKIMRKTNYLYEQAA